MTDTYSVPHRIEEVEGVVKLRCSDARDAGALEHWMKRYLELEYLARGIKPEVTSLSLAGTFMTPDVALEVASVLHRILASYPEFYRKDMLNLVVQIVGHGAVELVEGVEPDKIFYSTKELKIVDGCVFNCGMGHAREVWANFVSEMLGAKFNVEFFDKEKRKEVTRIINSSDELLSLLRNVYFFEGDDPLNFVGSIKNLLTHPNAQKKILRDLLNANQELGNVPIHTNASIVNYSTGFNPRLDGNEHVYTFLDDMSLLRKIILTDTNLLPADDPERVLRTSSQKDTVKVGLISSGSVNSARTKIAQWRTANNMETDVAGGVFAIITKTAVQQFSPFGPYKAVAFFYACHPDCLGITEFVILGKDVEEAKAIEFKMRSDPLMRFVIEKYSIRLTSVTAEQVEKRLSVSDQKSDEKYEQIVKKALRDLVVPGQSMLHKPVINKELRKLCVRKS